ncbi:hypothetical protein [Pedobacter antarcticus]|uniref:hypothetical protein n=1 Tax=Pedobacter antarcticus TaxID=34086 RepID=UPI0029312E55|nr:hypothetical protein [Pedobacter antarcticus]
MAYLSSDGNKILNNYCRFTGVPFNATIYSELPAGCAVDNAIWFRNRPEFGGGFSKRDFSGPVLLSWYGVKGDGVTNWTRIAQLCVDNVYAIGGGEIWFGDGRHMIDAGNSLFGQSTGGINLRSDITIVIPPSSQIKVISNANPEYCLFRADRGKNIHIKGGGSIVGDRYEHTGTGGEWGMGIVFNSSDNCSITDIDAFDFWGDGLYIGSAFDSKLIGCTNIYLDNFRSRNNRRQAASVVFVKRLFIKKSSFNGSDGTNPKAGLDLEPNANQYVEDVYIDDTYFGFNAGAGLQIFANKANCWVKNVNINKPTFENNGYGIRIRYSQCSEIKITNPTFKNSVVDHVAISEAATDIEINNMIASGTSQRSIALTGVKRARINGGKLEGSAIGIQLSTICEDVIVSTIDVSSNDYGLFSTSSRRLSIIGASSFSSKDSLLTESGIYVSGGDGLNVDDVSVKNSAKYPIRLNNVKLSKLNNAKLYPNEQSAQYGAIRLEGTSNENTISNHKLITDGVSTFRSGLQLTATTVKNFSFGNDFENGYSLSPSSDDGVSNYVDYNRVPKKLALGTRAGSVGIENSGQTVSLTSLLLASSTLFPDGNVLPAGAGLYSYINSNGSNYPSSSGAGLHIVRSENTYFGYFGLYKDNTNEEVLYVRYGAGATTLSPWRKVSNAQIINDPSTTDVVTRALLNTKYPVSTHGLNVEVRYYNQGKAYRRETSTIWSEQPLTLTT